MGLHQIKELPHSKGNSYQTKRQHTEWEKIFASYSSDKGLPDPLSESIGNSKTSAPKESMLQ
jgi:hypothetical protein